MALSTPSRAGSYHGVDTIVTLVPLVAPLVEVTKDIVRIARGARNKAWLEFAVYVHEVVRRVGLTLNTGQVGDGVLSTSIHELEMTLNRILRKTSTVATRPWIHRLLAFALDEPLIDDLRLQLDESVKLFEISILALMRRDICEALSRPSQTDAPASDSRREGGTGQEDMSQSVVICPPRTTKSEQELDLEENISSAYDNVRRYRKLVHEGSDCLVELADSLHRLSGLVEEAGRLEEALGLCQEAVNIYRSVAEPCLA